MHTVVAAKPDVKVWLLAVTRLVCSYDSKPVNTKVYINCGSPCTTCNVRLAHAVHRVCLRHPMHHMIHLVVVQSMNLYKKSSSHHHYQVGQVLVCSVHATQIVSVTQWAPHNGMTSHLNTQRSSPMITLHASMRCNGNRMKVTCAHPNPPRHSCEFSTVHTLLYNNNVHVTATMTHTVRHMCHA